MDVEKFPSAVDGAPLTHLELEDHLSAIEEAGVTDPYVFSSRTLIQATLPHSARAGNEITLRNGNTTVTMHSRAGLPYGHYPRLILFWLTREALRRSTRLPIDQARRIPLGNSLHKFLQEIGMIKGTYREGSAENPQKRRASGDSYAALHTQMKRLFATTISIDYDHSRPGKRGSSWDNVTISEGGFLWWDEAAPEENSGSFVILTERFFQELVEGAVPLDPLHLAVIYRYPLAIDLYGWATYRIAIHRGFTRVTWEQLKGQFGTSYPDTAQGMRDFRKKIRAARTEIKKAWPEGQISDWGGGLELRGHKPAVEKTAPISFSIEGNPCF